MATRWAASPRQGHSLGEPGHALARHTSDGCAETAAITPRTLQSAACCQVTPLGFGWNIGLPCISFTTCTAYIFSPKATYCFQRITKLPKRALAWRVAGGALACLCAFDLVRFTPAWVCKTGQHVVIFACYFKRQKVCCFPCEHGLGDMEIRLSDIPSAAACLHEAAPYCKALSAGVQVQSGINIQGDRPSGAPLPVTAFTFEAPRVGAPSMPAKLLPHI